MTQKGSGFKSSTMEDQQPYYTIRSRRPAGGNGTRQGEFLPASASVDGFARSATHEISRTSFHVKHIGAFARRLEDSAARAFPNRGRTSQRYKQVQALLLHWGSDDLFVLPELEDLERCLRLDYAFGTDVFAIPSENSHLELMMRVGQLIKEYESQDTLFLIYYGGHARIDESRQSTWCATRHAESPWLQWSAIQTLLERSKSDVLILLDCCAGAASATFPNGNSITETISASSWDAIAPDPGRYSFTNALIEVLQEWRLRSFSAAMLHAEVLARLKHPRPITINGKHFEARSTPVHFMMTANHKAPSIEMTRLLAPEKATEPMASGHAPSTPTGRAADSADFVAAELVPSEPNEDSPHVMISLALEDDQRLDINAWEQWLNAFPAMAKYVKVQGVFKSHSTMMLLSMPVMVWDLLPEDPAVSFVAFIRSNNLALQKQQLPQRMVVPSSVRQPQGELINDTSSFVTGVSGTTVAATEHVSVQPPFWLAAYGSSSREPAYGSSRIASASQPTTPGRPASPPSSSPGSLQWSVRPVASSASLTSLQRQATGPPVSGSSTMISRQMVMNQQQSMRRTTFGDNVPEPKKFAAHVERRLEEYYQEEPLPNDAQSAFIASNLGIEPRHLEVWFHHRRERDSISHKLATMKLKDAVYEASHGPRMILAADLSRLLEIALPGDALLFDLRSPAEYERSHIFRAIHLRIPRSVLRSAPLELIERAIPDEQGRRQLTQWPAAKCIVFYGRGLEYPWECPVADLVAQKLWKHGWVGRCFILRGHYREFCQSFAKHIVGAKMTQGAEDWVSGQATVRATDTDRQTIEQQYSAWLDRVENEDRARPLSASPTQTLERFEALERQEKDVEAEFKARCGALFGKAAAGDDLIAKASMVEYLDRVLEKLRCVQDVPPTSFPSRLAKLPSEDYGEGCFGKRQEQDFEAEYVEVIKDSPAEVASVSGIPDSPESNSPADHSGLRGGGLLHKMFRR
ncbi:tyrosine-protein phosphatase non-receptor type 6 [Metarhizium album ARSEF 1941]|uniref:Tyrosine-protein phosphatase non-receptor type 6 n=1 Tax=Metarhizium album (strain ARSEF 1941) TaxID=1081103 RepID=A0A0B2WX45_METAS|nr:tyrosine-protein phosphatase non-receptor type 6 [Metarhizium album ARSEF 1941]KHO00782.1 tyrosine-protein phosphatase non-receptor type 6 [Metarhizium album ARSEF 1941]